MRKLKLWDNKVKKIEIKDQILIKRWIFDQFKSKVWETMVKIFKWSQTIVIKGQNWNKKSKLEDNKVKHFKIKGQILKKKVENWHNKVKSLRNKGQNIQIKSNYCDSQNYEIRFKLWDEKSKLWDIKGKSFEKKKSNSLKKKVEIW